MKFWVVDACSDTLFKGNPAAVCVLEEFLDSALMQNIAAELKISETAFVVPVSSSEFKIRWFTPEDEAPICGHATLAAAHILWEEKMTQSPLLSFEYKAGTLTAERKASWITLSLPSQPLSPCAHPPLDLYQVGNFEFKNVCYGYPGFGGHYLVELASQEEVEKFSPNLALLKKIPCRALTVTARAFAPYDFIYRYFAPSVGLDEDPVCVSAQCRLTPYWADQLKKTSFLSRAGSKRGGVLKSSLGQENILVSGQAITSLEGKLRLEKDI